MKNDILARIKQLPDVPGVYLYKNLDGEIIYVGKAKNLKRRMKQYFQSRTLDIKTQALVREIADFEIIKTDSELDALFLEGELIKRYKPAFNILLRDDKNVTYIKISGDFYPVVSYTRQPLDDGGEYFGPFYSIFSVKQAMRYLRWIFPYLTRPLESKSVSRLEWHIGLNPKLEVGSRKEIQQQRQKYLADLKQVRRYIRGERRQVIIELEREMQRAAAKQDFETAAKLRNQVRALESLQQKVRIVSEEQDISQDHGLRDLQELFGLSTAPNRIEGFDISHVSGTNVVASMVVFINGLAARTEYRKFKTKIDQNNDFYNMYETIQRRFKNQQWPRPDLMLIDGGKGQLSSAIMASDGQTPMLGLAEKQELIVVDRKKSNVALKAKKLAEMGGLAFEEGDFWLIKLPESNSVLKLLKRLRDEAHRFAVGYHTKLRAEAQKISALDQIRGIGPQTRQKLLKKYKTLSNIKRAGKVELTEVIGKRKSELIWRALNNQK